VEEVGQRGKDLGREPSQLLAVGEGELAQHGLALRGHRDQDLPLVQLVPDAAEQPDRGHAVHELPDRVMFELELPRQRPDRGEAVLGQSLDGEKQLVLPGPKALLPGGLLAEDQEAPDQVPEAGKGVVVRLGRAGVDRGHPL